MFLATRSIRTLLGAAALSLVQALVSVPAARAQASPAAVPQLPQRVVYGALFRHIVFLQQQASALEQQGKNTDALRNFYQVNGGLTAAQGAALTQMAQNAATAIQAANAQIQAEIKILRAQTPRPSPGSKAPAPPAILKTLQAQKDAAIMNQVQALYNLLGPAQFQQFDSFVQATVGPHISVTTAQPAGH